jgi:predicted HicB family RNase H-like nuclease
VDILKYKEYEGTAELDMHRGVCRGKILFVDDLVTYEADSPRELQKEFEAAVDDYIETCATLGKEPQRPFRGLFNVRVPPELHRAAALRATSDTVSLNDVMVRALDCFLNVRADVNHNIKVTLEGPTGGVQTVRAVASGKAQWGTANVH